MTEIAKLGEFGLIRHLTEGIKPKNASTLRGNLKLQKDYGQY